MSDVLTDEELLKLCRRVLKGDWVTPKQHDTIARALKQRLASPTAREGWKLVTHQDLRDFYNEWTIHEDGEDKTFADALLPIIEGKISVAAWIAGDAPPSPDGGGR